MNKCEHDFKEVGRGYDNDYMEIYYECSKCGEESNVCGPKKEVENYLKLLKEKMTKTKKQKEFARLKRKCEMALEDYQRITGDKNVSVEVKQLLSIGDLF